MCEIWRSLAEHRDPGACFTADARIEGSDRSYAVRLIDAVPIEGARVVAVAAAGWGGTAELVSVLFTFDGPLAASSRVFHSREGAFLAAGVAPPSP